MLIAGMFIGIGILIYVYVLPNHSNLVYQMVVDIPKQYYIKAKLLPTYYVNAVHNRVRSKYDTQYKHTKYNYIKAKYLKHQQHVDTPKHQTQYKHTNSRDYNYIKSQYLKHKKHTSTSKSRIVFPTHVQATLPMHQKQQKVNYAKSQVSPEIQELYDIESRPETYHIHKDIKLPMSLDTSHTDIKSTLKQPNTDVNPVTLQKSTVTHLITPTIKRSIPNSHATTINHHIPLQPPTLNLPQMHNHFMKKRPINTHFKKLKRINFSKNKITTASPLKNQLSDQH